MDKSKLFAIWLEGYMAACGPVLNEEQTNVVKAKLNDLFEHEAEPVQPKLTLEELGEEQHGLPFKNGLHDRDDDGTLYRC